MPLRVKALELHGYKTFAARTVFEFAEGITAIVGPNGAGKSNIADALRWVLGEQSYGLLRGKKTEDMIFSGSEHRPRAGMASAEVIFDNSAGWLPIDFAEVAVARRAYRDGHNEYVLNSQHVRLRDMNELLAAAGLSERTYTVVGQGLVDASLALKADERRRLFEEAAGVGLYRVRREEALRRLETTRRNVERVQDILGEIEPRLKTLERQARRANEYAAAQEDLRAVLREWYGYHWHHSQVELEAAHGAVESRRSEAETARAALEASQNQYGELRGRLSQLRTRLDALHRESAELREQHQSMGLSIAVLEERRRALVGTETALSGEQQLAEGTEDISRQRLLEAQERMQQAEIELRDAASQLASVQQELQTRQSARRGLEGELLTAGDKAAEIAARGAEAQARLDALDASLRLIDERLASLTRTLESAQKDVSEAEQMATDAAAARAQSEKRLQQRQAEFDAVKERLTREEQIREAQLQERSKFASSQSRLNAQLEILEQAAQAMSGFAEGARFLLDAARDDRLEARGARSAVLELPRELEMAIGAALGDAVDSVLLDAAQVDRGLDLLETPQSGRAVLLPVNAGRGQGLTPPTDGELLGVASDLVKAPPELRGAVELLLGGTLVVRSRAAAQRLLPLIPVHARIVTLRGEVFRGDGLIAAGQVAPSSTLSRPRQMRELASSVADAEARIAAVDERIEVSAQTLRGLQGDLGAAGEASDVARVDLANDQILEDKGARELETRRRALDWERGRHLELVEERSNSAEERKVLASQAQDLDASAEGARAEVHRLRGQINEMSLEDLQTQVAYWSTRVAVTEQTVGTVRSRASEEEAALQSSAGRKTALQLRSAEVRESLQQVQTEKSALLEQQRAMLVQLEALQATITPLQTELEEIQAQEGSLEGEETASQRNASSAERTLSQAEIDLVRRQEAVDSLRARIIDDFGLVSLEYASSVEGPVPLPFEGLVEELPVVSSLGPEVEDLLMQRRGRLRRLGLVNPEAAKEYEAESERFSFLSTQIRDLLQAEEDLRRVIAELDELTRREFSRTYEAVDKQFRTIFTRLFGGGSAHLELTDPDNLVETGIEIEARLPGRREQGLSLLSGGERSLTAIALVCALLKVSPTPVCVLDEVDAMLDEANVGRFRDLLTELSQETQFIIITHNRNTVQAADFIYGVTMGRDSTSQVISLKLDEVSEEMLGARPA